MENLTPRQKQVSLLFAEMGSYKDVASHLNISPKSVEHHLKMVRNALNLKNSLDLVKVFASEIQVQKIGIFELSSQELNVLRSLSCSNKEIAKSLNVKVKTVEMNLASIFKKTGFCNRFQLLAYYLKYPECFTCAEKRTTKQKIIEMRSQGLNPKAIAQQLNIRTGYIYECNEGGK